MKKRKFNMWGGAILALSVAIVGCNTPSSSDSDDDNTTSPTVLSGTLVDAAVGGVAYSTATQSGTTDVNGKFTYLENETISFSIGGTTLGEMVGKSVATPIELTGSENENDPKVINMLRFLQTLDNDGDASNGIEITNASVTALANDKINFNQSIAAFETAIQPSIVRYTKGNKIEKTEMIGAAAALNHFKGQLQNLGVPIHGTIDFASDLFFSEYIEGSSNNKALEIYNGTGATVDLSNYTITRYSNGADLGSGVDIALSGAIANGDVYVIAHSSYSNQVFTETPDNHESSQISFNGDDAVVLYKGGGDNVGTIVDVFGQVGLDPGSSWGSGDQTTANHTLRRKSTICAGDIISSDAFDPTVEWDFFDQNNADDLGAHNGCGAVDLAPTLASSTPSASAVGVRPWGNIDVRFSEKVTLASDWYSISCSVSGAHPATVTGAGKNFQLDPTTDFTRGESCTVTIAGAKVTDLDGDINPIGDNVSFSFTVLESLVCDASATMIHSIQGSGAESAMDGNTVEIQGVVVGDFQGSNKLSGFFVQEEDSQIDTDDSTSEGIYVFDGSFGADVAVGNIVRVNAEVDEYQGLTELTSVNNITICPGVGTATAANVSFPVTDGTYLERYEGMAVKLIQELYVTELYHLGRGGQVTLSSNARLPQPTNVAAPGTPASNQAAANLLNLIYLDDGTRYQNQDPAYPSPGLSASNTLRGGDSATGIEGVMTYADAGYSSSSTTGYRVHPTADVTFVHNNTRSATPPTVTGTLKVASFNVLNYFNGDGEGNNIGDGRGADNLEEFNRQRAKTIAAISALDADIVGLMEMENDYDDGTKSAIQDLINGLNAATAAGTYSYVDPGAKIGTDAIAVGMIYKSGTVSLVGNHAILDDSVAGTHKLIAEKNRPVLAQTFRHTASGGVLTIAVNHFKSKGSNCDDDGDDTNVVHGINDPDTNDGQGNCNLTRTSAANAEREWLATDPTSSGDSDFLIIGDLNAYAMEDPVSAFTNNGYTNLISTHMGADAYSYVFDGRWGYLDHALSSATLTPQVNTAADWHINADEPPVLDYNTNFQSSSQQTNLYAADAFRASDHDPVIVGLTLTAD